ncbi:MAG: tetratricopeptide repeat protein [Clostridia bacterium]|nr:tetratricopeptide repeat protein [Clostridia bacterium]
MGFLTKLNANKAYRLHVKGDLEAAKAGYDQAYAEGLSDPKLLSTYAVLLLRLGDYERAVEVLRKAEKAPGITADQKNQVIQHYAVAIWKLGQKDRALDWLWKVFRNQKTGTLYGVLGFLLIEKAVDDKTAIDEALAFNLEAVDYDEDDPVCLDNLAQAYYRLLDDKDAARPYFERALAQKPGAVDTNYFLAQYDVEAGRTAQAIEKLETVLEGRISPLNYVTREMVEAQLAQLRGKE